MKQLRMIYGCGFSEDERRSFTKLVFQDIFHGVKAMTDAMKKLNIPYSNPQNEVIKRPSVFKAQRLMSAISFSQQSGDK